MSATAQTRATHVTPDAILQLGLGFWGSKTLLSAVELGLFTELAARARSTREALRERLGLHPRGARDFLRRARRAGHARARGRRATRNTPATDLFLDRAKPSYVGGMLEMANARLYGFWGSLTEALRTGEPQNEAKTGGDLFDALYADPDAARGSSCSAMTGHQHRRGAWPSPRRSRGTATRRSSTSAAPRAACRSRSRWPTSTSDRRRLRPAGRRADLRRVRRRRSGSPTACVPRGRLLRRPAAEGRRAGHGPHPARLGPATRSGSCSRKAYDALPDGGALIVYEAIIDDDRRENAFGLLMSLNMLIETPGGFDYTGADCQRLDARGGLQRDATSSTSSGPDSMVVGIK